MYCIFAHLELHDAMYAALQADMFYTMRAQVARAGTPFGKS